MAVALRLQFEVPPPCFCGPLSVFGVGTWLPPCRPHRRKESTDPGPLYPTCSFPPLPRDSRAPNPFPYLSFYSYFGSPGAVGQNSMKDKTQG